jgi:hypothetical protein
MNDYMSITIANVYPLDVIIVIQIQKPHNF